MSHPLLRDPFVAAEVDAAVAPYARLLSSEDIDWLKDQLATLLDEDAEARILLRQAHPTTVGESGEQTRIGVEADDDVGKERAG